MIIAEFLLVMKGLESKENFFIKNFKSDCVQGEKKLDVGRI